MATIASVPLSRDENDALLHRNQGHTEGLQTFALRSKTSEPQRHSNEREQHFETNKFSLKSAYHEAYDDFDAISVAETFTTDVTSIFDSRALDSSRDDAISVCTEFTITSAEDSASIRTVTQEEGTMGLSCDLDFIFTDANPRRALAREKKRDPKKQQIVCLPAPKNNPSPQPVEEGDSLKSRSTDATVTADPEVDSQNIAYERRRSEEKAPVLDTVGMVSPPTPVEIDRRGSVVLSTSWGHDILYPLRDHYEALISKGKGRSAFECFRRSNPFGKGQLRNMIYSRLRIPRTSPFFSLGISEENPECLRLLVVDPGDASGTLGALRLGKYVYQEVLLPDIRIERIPPDFTSAIEKCLRKGNVRRDNQAGCLSIRVGRYSSRHGPDSSNILNHYVKTAETLDNAE